jgi:hypothetical protein
MTMSVTAPPDCSRRWKWPAGKSTAAASGAICQDRWREKSVLYLPWESSQPLVAELQHFRANITDAGNATFGVAIAHFY